MYSALHRHKEHNYSCFIKLRHHVPDLSSALSSGGYEQALFIYHRLGTHVTTLLTLMCTLFLAIFTFLSTFQSFRVAFKPKDPFRDKSSGTIALLLRSFFINRKNLDVLAGFIEYERFDFGSFYFDALEDALLAWISDLSREVALPLNLYFTDPVVCPYAGKHSTNIRDAVIDMTEGMLGAEILLRSKSGMRFENSLVFLIASWSYPMGEDRKLDFSMLFKSCKDT